MTSRMSSRDRPSAGSSIREEPPPDRSSSTVSPGDASPASLMAALAPLTELSSGVGWPASMISNPSSSPLECPYFVRMTPFSSRWARCPAAARAMTHAAFPTATTYTLPDSLMSFRASRTARSGRTSVIVL